MLSRGDSRGGGIPIPTELWEYVAEARHCPTLLAAQLAPLGLAVVRARLRCDDVSALRLLMCERPCVYTWDRDVALVAACAEVDRGRLDRLLREVGAGDRINWPEVLQRARGVPPGSGGQAPALRATAPSGRREGHPDW